LKHFIITGASKGLGEGIALALLHENHHIIYISRSESPKLTSMAAAKDCQLDFFPFDLADTQNLPALAKEVFECVDIRNSTGIYLINNAGIIQPVGRAETNDSSEVDLHMRINLIAPMILSAGFIESFQDTAVQKRIMNISSGAAKNPYYGWSSYCTGKAGLDMYGRCVALEQEEAKYPIEVMAVAPGIIDTNMQTTLRAVSEEQFIYKKMFVEFKESGQLVPPTLAGKKLAALLVSEDFVSGSIIDLRE
jgi:benzil reductase ((S)-benzoin forming)